MPLKQRNQTKPKKYLIVAGVLTYGRLEVKT